MEPYYETQRKIDLSYDLSKFATIWILIYAFLSAFGCSALVEEKNDPNDSGTDSSSIVSSDATDSSSTAEGSDTDTSSGTSTEDVEGTETEVDTTGPCEVGDYLCYEPLDWPGHFVQYSCDPEWLIWMEHTECLGTCSNKTPCVICEPEERDDCNYVCSSDGTSWEIKPLCPEELECKLKPGSKDPYCEPR
jgi:hypothetical protein